MKKQPGIVNLLLSLIIFLSLASSAVGLFWQEGGQPFDFTSIHGASIKIYGQGLYKFDTYFKAPIFRGTDAVTLFIAIPLLIVGMVLSNRGLLRGRIFLAGILSYFLYVSASLSFGAAYNFLFLVYIILFSTSFFTFVTTLSSFDLQSLPAHFSPRLPRRFIAGFLFVEGLSVFVWLIDIISGLTTGQVPAGLAHYTTDITAVIDIGIIPPAAYLAGILMLRRSPLGFVLAPILMILNALVGMMVLVQTIFQSMAGITLSTGQVIAYVGIFVTTSLFAIYLTFRFFKNMSESKISS